MSGEGLCGVAGEHLRPHFATLVRVAAAGLADGAERVRAAALAAVAKLVEWVAEEPEVKAFRELVPTMLQVRLALRWRLTALTACPQLLQGCGSELACYA